MLAAPLVVALLLGQVPQADARSEPAALVERLGASRYADRQAAALALQHIGRPALAALRAARATRDPEVRTRASSLIHKIEAALLTQPTTLRLDFKNATLPEVAQSLAIQTGVKLALYPQNSPRWKKVRVTLKQTQPVEFWKALDELCEVAGLQYNSNLHGFGSQREPILPLTDGSMHPLMPTFDHGPFRVRLLGMEYQRRLSYGPVSDPDQPPPAPRPLPRQPDRPEHALPTRLNPITTVHFMAQIGVDAEPRLSVTHRGSLRVIEAVDNLGNSMLPRAGERLSSGLGSDFAIVSGPGMQLQAQLHRPDVAGDTIKKFRGVIPLAVSSRQSDPLIVPLKPTTAGKTFENPDVRLTVHAIRAAPNSSKTLPRAVRHQRRP